MILFLDNLRGFSNAFLEFNDFNILVGENSTGKSTVLSILSLLSDLNFNSSGEFKNKYVEFGPFQEIINRNSKSKESFSIALTKQHNEDWGQLYDQVYFNYVERNGFTTVKRFVVKIKDQILDLTFSEKKIKIVIKENPATSLDNWLHSLLNSGNIIREDTVDFPLPLLERLSNSPHSFLFLLTSFVKENLALELFIQTAPRFGTLIKDTTWIDPIRSKPKRTYDPTTIEYSAEGEHIPTILRDIFLSRDQHSSKKIIQELEAFGKSSGLFDKILVDQYRKSIDAPFALLFKLGNKRLKISNVGYGISQILPIIVEVVRERSNSIFLIQQPEVHLHPRSQAYTGQFFFNQFASERKRFVIETHSDFIIDRFRMNIRQSSQRDLHKRVNVLFFEHNSQGNIATKITLDKNGDYSQEQPKKFREFFLKEEIKLLGL